MSGISVDISGALAKNKVLATIPAATRYQLTKFSADVTKSLKESAMRMKGADKYRRKTGALARSVGFKVQTLGEYYQATIGTGIGTAKDNQIAQKYAMIQDKGGVTHPTVTKKMRGWAWYMFYKTKEEKFKGIALTKKQRLTVHIPASLWFTAPWEHKLQFLNSNYLNDRIILTTAEKMTGGANAS